MNECSTGDAADTPPGNRIECRATNDQMVLRIAAGRNQITRDIGRFATFWLGITAAGTYGLSRPERLISMECLVLASFWAIGLALLYFWMRGRFGETHVLVERNRLVIKFALWGLEQIREYDLRADSSADLVVTCYEGGRSTKQEALFTVAVSTSGRPAKFGTYLSNEEKLWIVKRVNRLLLPESD